MRIHKSHTTLLALATLACTTVSAAAHAGGHSRPHARQGQALCAPRRAWTPQDSATIGQQINRTPSQVNNGLDNVKRLSSPTHPVYAASSTAAAAFAAAEGITQAQAQAVLSQYMRSLCDA